MSVPTVIQGDVIVKGNLQAATQTIPSGAVGDAAVAALAGIQASKVIHDQRHTYSQASNASVSNITQVMAVVIGSASTAIVFEAGAIAPATSPDSCTIDLKSNGTSILSSPITLNSSQTARQLVQATFANATLSVGQVLEIAITGNHTSGSLPVGVFATLQINEANQ